MQAVLPRLLSCPRATKAQLLLIRPNEGCKTKGEGHHCLDSCTQELKWWNLSLSPGSTVPSGLYPCSCKRGPSVFLGTHLPFQWKGSPTFPGDTAKILGLLFISHTGSYAHHWPVTMSEWEVLIGWPGSLPWRDES